MLYILKLVAVCESNYYCLLLLQTLAEWYLQAAYVWEMCGIQS